MDFAGINYLAVFAAAVAAFAFGAVYYRLLFKPWLRAVRLAPEEMRMSPMPFATSFLAKLIMGWVLAGVIGHLGENQVTLRNGVVSSAFVWFGFMATTLAVNHRYQGFGWNLTLIDAGHWLGVALLMGAIIGWFGI